MIAIILIIIAVVLMIIITIINIIIIIIINFLQLIPKDFYHKSQDTTTSLTSYYVWPFKGCW